MSVREVWEKLESRLIKEGTHSEVVCVCVWGCGGVWGVGLGGGGCGGGGGGGGLRLIEPALRHGVPLPSSHPDPCELDPGEQCRRREGGGAERGGGEAGRGATSLGNK